ncbi:MAG: hypothetical protein LKJ17_07590 [Oscillospiraceae bacterium]|nr:hypothetical protein [Oscillospiraceae bacterium]
MKSLSEYFQKNIRLTDVDGKQWSGRVETWTPAIDSEDDVEEIGLMTPGQGLIGFKQTEIQSITIE